MLFSILIHDEFHDSPPDVWEDFDNIIIIWTCRSGDYLNQMRAFLLKNGIPFDFINENPIVDYGSPKVFANEYHDDRNAVVCDHRVDTYGQTRCSKCGEVLPYEFHTGEANE